ncbi:MAG: DNA polymerase III subunit chi [Burkholderiaceae bacterium]
MTEVSFHFNAPDKLAYACRLLRKAATRGSRVAVTGGDVLRQQLDRDLWTFSATEFVPHCSDTSASRMLAVSPVIFCESASAAPHQEVLLNLGPRVAEGFERFERLIEVVGNDPADREESRVRWKYYRDRGYAIVRHDFAERGSN